jgi:hypothetical protein
MGYSKEQAERVLQENPEIDGSMRTYFQAIVEGTLPEYYLDLFTHKKTDYSDELPSVDVRTLIDDPQRLTKYKCQGNYVVGLSLSLQQAMSDGVISDGGLKRKIEGFIKSDLDFQVGDPNNNSRINHINEILNKTLTHISSKRR